MHTSGASFKQLSILGTFPAQSNKPKVIFRGSF
jgi:hypothetical protein